MSDRYVLWGSAGHAKVLAEVLEASGHRVVALFDNNASVSSAIAGVPLFVGEKGFLEWLASERDVSSVRALAAMGGARGKDRLAMHRLFEKHHVPIAAPLVHPQAVVSPSATLGPGTQVLGLALVASEVRLGEACILNHKASADHESVLGDGVHLAPGATLCGCVTVGDNVLVGAGAIVVPRVTIGKNTIIGAGSVVTRDVPEGVLAFGNPARVVRANV